MEKFKSIVFRVFTIPLWLLIILCVISAFSLVFIFTNGLDTQFYAYIAYFVSAYTLTSLCFYCATTLPDLIKNIKGKAIGNKYISKYTSDKTIKVKSGLYLSFLINFVYIFTNVFSAFYYKTAWFGIFAVYYALLTIMSFILSVFILKNRLDKDRIGELKTARACSFFMLMINLALSAAVLMMMYQGRGFEQHGILIYVIALYTFYSTIRAVVDVIKYRKFSNPIITTSKMVKLADALISVLLLETSMLAQFGMNNTLEFKRLMISLTGGGIAVIITFMAVYIFIQSNIKLKQIKS